MDGDDSDSHIWTSQTHSNGAGEHTSEIEREKTPNEFEG